MFIIYLIVKEVKLKSDIYLSKNPFFSCNQQILLHFNYKGHLVDTPTNT